MMARALKLDPVEFRRKNILRDGRPQATGTLMKDAAIEAVLDRARAAHELERGRSIAAAARCKRGRGIAIGFKASISPTTSIAIVNVAADGSCTLYCSTVDMGQGSDTANAQIVAEVLNIPAESVRGRASRHRRDALRHGDARLALALPHGQRGAARRRGRAATSSRRSRASSACRRAATSRSPSCSQKKYKMQAGNIIGIGSYIPSYVPPDASRARRRGDAVLDGRRRRRRGRGRYRDRPCARDASSSTSSTSAGRSIRASWRRSSPARP